MAFRNLMLTTYGMMLYAKAQQGKQLHLTRVAVGDGLLSSGESIVNRSALKNERASFLIDYVQIASSSFSAEVVTTMRNDELTEGFYFRELGICALDPDTGAEYVYLYDYAGEDGEYIPAASENTQVIERLKMPIKLENTPNVTFTPSGNPLYLTLDDIRDHSVGANILWSSQRIQAALDAAVGLASATLRLDIAIPTAGWVADTDTGGGYALHADVLHADITEAMVPALTILPASLETAVTCGLSPVTRTFDGTLRVYAKSRPSAAMYGSLALLENAGGSSGGAGVGDISALPIASAAQLGGVKIGDNISVAEDGTIATEDVLSQDNVAGEDDAEAMLKDVFESIRNTDQMFEGE